MAKAQSGGTRRPLPSRREFAHRLLKNFAVAAILIGLSLLAGMAGYHWLERMPWLDAYTNAAMLLSGMGPLDSPKTAAGKVFAGTYALYSGLAVLVAAAVLLTPVLHRVVHKFHLEQDRAE
jgi:hypothetical protein